MLKLYAKHRQQKSLKKIQQRVAYNRGTDTILIPAFTTPVARTKVEQALLEAERVLAVVQFKRNSDAGMRARHYVVSAFLYTPIIQLTAISGQTMSARQSMQD